MKRITQIFNRVNFKVFASFLLLCIAQVVQAQTDKSYILDNTNVAELQRIAAEEAQRYATDYEEALQKARIEGWPTINLVRLDEFGEPVYEAPTNNTAASLTNTIVARGFLNAFGTGMKVGMWEANDASGRFRPRTTHQDFGMRVTQQDPGVGFSSHSTHVAGTLIGSPPSGVSVNSTGMATLATLDAYSSAGDVGEMTTAASNGLLISNHSYAVVAGYSFDQWLDTGFPFYHNYKQWTWNGGTSQFNASGNDPSFGVYNSSARTLDLACYNAPFYLPVFAAGNDHNDNPITHLLGDDQVRNGSGGAYVNYDPASHPAGDGFQPCTMVAKQCATNVLTVGNMTKTLLINESSSRGATDDGRIKPDICGIGTDVYSADVGSDTDYGNKTGTSMAAPNVAGSLLILQEGYENYHGSGKFMRSATLKALALHTAIDYGNPGPDYTFGWGLLNTFAASIAIQQDAWQGGGSSSHIMIEASLDSPSDTYVYTFNTDGTDPIKVTLVYTDPVLAGSSTPLQNDLDLFLIDNSLFVGYEPFKLDPNNPGNNATTGDNDIDNVEQVSLSAATAQAGLYTVNVSLENAALFGNVPQDFSLIISGNHPTCHYDIHHKSVTLPSSTYAAQNNIISEVNIESGTTINYQYGGKVVLKPGFHAKQSSYFATSATTCN